MRGAGCRSNAADAEFGDQRGDVDAGIRHCQEPDHRTDKDSGDKPMTASELTAADLPLDRDRVCDQARAMASASQMPVCQTGRSL